jgi:formiminotetrahydrofolate cyclodeaminase
MRHVKKFNESTDYKQLAIKNYLNNIKKFKSELEGRINDINNVFKELEDSYDLDLDSDNEQKLLNVESAYSTIIDMYFYDRFMKRFKGTAQNAISRINRY